KKPSWYLVPTDDKMIPPAAQRFMSKRASSTVVESSGSHAIYVSRPEDVASIIKKAAQARCRGVMPQPVPVSRRRGPLLLNPEIGLADHLAPLRKLGLDPIAEFRRRAPDRIKAEHRQAFPHVGQCNRLDDLAMEKIND